MHLSLEADVKYLRAFRLVQRIDEHLTKDSRHFRDRSGELLLDLEQVVRAILDDDLADITV